MTNIATEVPFIPVTFHNGTTRDVTIYEALTKADEIVAITTPNVQYQVSLTRLLCAVMVRAHQPYDRDTQVGLFRKGSFDLDAVASYLNTWHDRFNLDGRTPFFQVPDIDPDLLKSIATLDPYRSSGSNVLVWDHTCDHDIVEITPAEAARLIIAQHAYGIPGLATGVVPGQSRLAAKFSPLSATCAVIADTGSLHTTLLAASPHTMTHTADLPAWERDPDTVHPKQREATGMVDRFTWQSRRVLLGPPTPEGNYTTGVTAAGTTLDNDDQVWHVDPHLVPIKEATWEKNEPPGTGETIKVLMSYISDRSWTLNSPLIFVERHAKTDKNGKTTLTYRDVPEHLTVARDIGIIGARTRIGIYRQCLNQAKLLAVFRRTVNAYLTNDDTEALNNIIDFVNSVDQNIGPDYWATINANAPQIKTMESAAAIVSNALRHEPHGTNSLTHATIRAMNADEDDT